MASTVYGVLPYSGGGFVERYEARSDRDAIAVFLSRSRVLGLGPWNADLFRIDEVERLPLVVMRADAMQGWLDDTVRRRARSRWLYVRDGSEWRVGFVDPVEAWNDPARAAAVVRFVFGGRVSGASSDENACVA